MKKVIVCLLIVLCTACCGNDDNTIDGATDIQIATGMILTDVVGNKVGAFGNPNVLTRITVEDDTNTDATSDDGNLTVGEIVNNIAVYPSLTTNGYFSIGASKTVEKVWLVKAAVSKKYQDVDYSTLLTNSLYTEEEISDVATITLALNASSSPVINISDMEQGIYKVFMLFSDGEIAWDIISVGYTYDELTTLW